MDASERHERSAKYMPTPAQIARAKHRINMENYPERLSSPDYKTPDDDSDAELEGEADTWSRRT